MSKESELHKLWPGAPPSSTSEEEAACLVAMTLRLMERNPTFRILLVEKLIKDINLHLGGENYE